MTCDHNPKWMIYLGTLEMGVSLDWSPDDGKHCLVCEWKETKAKLTRAEGEKNFYYAILSDLSSILGLNLIVHTDGRLSDEVRRMVKALIKPSPSTPEGITRLESMVYERDQEIKKLETKLLACDENITNKAMQIECLHADNKRFREAITNGDETLTAKSLQIEQLIRENDTLKSGKWEKELRQENELLRGREREQNRRERACPPSASYQDQCEQLIHLQTIADEREKTIEVLTKVLMGGAALDDGCECGCQDWEDKDDENRRLQAEINEVASEAASCVNAAKWKLRTVKEASHKARAEYNSVPLPTVYEGNPLATYAAKVSHLLVSLTNTIAELRGEEECQCEEEDEWEQALDDCEKELAEAKLEIAKTPGVMEHNELLHAQMRTIREAVELAKEEAQNTTVDVSSPQSASIASQAWERLFNNLLAAIDLACGDPPEQGDEDAG